MMRNKGKLDQIVVDIEFLLISVIQGVALGAVAAGAIGPLTNLQFQYWPYIVSAFLLILIFWAQAIAHVLSFIRWPISLTHNFLYFLASMIEVMIFSQMSSPMKWFGFYLAFVVISAFLYYYDILLIRRCLKSELSLSEKVLINQALKEQTFEFSVFVPAGILFNLGAFLLIFFYPAAFVGQRLHLILITLQIIFALYILASTQKSFKKRLSLIEKL